MNYIGANETISKDMTQKPKGTKKINKGVSCDVKNCTYHDGESNCFAEKISVGPSFATACTDTVCATFKIK